MILIWHWYHWRHVRKLSCHRSHTYEYHKLIWSLWVYINNYLTAPGIWRFLFTSTIPGTRKSVPCCKLRHSSCRQSNLDSDSCSSPGPSLTTWKAKQIYHCVVALGSTSYVGLQCRCDTCSFSAILHFWHVRVNGGQNRAASYNTCSLSKRDPQKSCRHYHTTSWLSTPTKVCK